MSYSQFVNVELLPAPEPTSLPTDIPHTSDLNKIKKYVRNGKWTISQGTRRHLWKHLLDISRYSSAADDCPAIETFRAQKAAFFEDAGGSTREALDLLLVGCQERNLRVPKMVQGDFALAIYCLNKEGVTSLQVVLTIVSLTYPQISYCPLLAPIASLCLHFMTEEETYACLSRLILKEFNSDGMQYLPTNSISYAAFCQSLFSLVVSSDASGKSYNNVKNLVNPREQLQDWIWWIFRDLPLSYLVRIMDCFLVEGLKVLYRTALTILMLQKKHSNNNTLEENAIRNFVKSIEKVLNEEKFTKAIFKLKMPGRVEIAKAVESAKEEVRSSGAATNGTSGACLATSQISGGTAIVLETINSDIIDQDQLHSLWLWLPAKSSVFQPKILYQTSNDGFNLSQLYRKVENLQPIIIIIITLNKEIFGAYISVPLKERHKFDKGMGFFGDGQTFLFTLSPQLAKYSWVNNSYDPGSSLFVSAQEERLVIGGGNHEGLAVDWALDKGTSRTCSTFENPPLAASSSETFSIKNLEVISLKDD